MLHARRAVLCTAVIAVAALSGCGAVDDNDVAASVGDTELTRSELSDRVAAAAPGGAGESAGGRVSGDAARQSIETWVWTRIADDIGLLGQYAEAGALPITCIYVVPAASRDDAQAMVDGLAAGDSWNDVTASVDPMALAQARQPCGALASYPPEIADQLAVLTPDGPAIVIEAAEPAASFVVRAQTLDELNISDFLTAIQQTDPGRIDEFVAALEAAEIVVDPEFGTFDLARFSVVPLG